MLLLFILLLSLPLGVAGDDSTGVVGGVSSSNSLFLGLPTDLLAKGDSLYFCGE